MTDAVDELILPVVEEHLLVGRRTVATGKVRVSTVVEDRSTEVRAALAHDTVEIERVAVGEEVLVIPPIREEGDTIVVPVVREEIVVTKRLILVEEVRLRRVTTVEDHVEIVVLKTQQAVIDRQTLSTPEES